jgi:zinc transport system permease protein
MVVPVATAQQVTRSFRATLHLSMLLGAIASLAGLTVSAAMSSTATVAPGSTIVLLALSGFLLSWPAGVLLRKRQRLSAPFPIDHEPDSLTHGLNSEIHPHQHGDRCGHRAVRHGDHFDYVHDGHRHATHGEHYDEH